MGSMGVMGKLYTRALTLQPSVQNHNSKAVPVQAWTGHWGFTRLRLQEVPDDRHMMLSALRTGHLNSQEISLILNYQRLNRPKGHSAAESI